MMKRFIRQKNRNSKTMGVVLLIAVLCLSVVYAALYSVIYMYGTGSVDISYKDLYYSIDSGGGKFYTSCTNGTVTSSTGITKMSVAVNALKEGGTIHMLSPYSATAEETVSINSKTVKIQRYVQKDENDKVEYSNEKEPLFNVSANLKFDLVKVGTEAPCLTIDGSEITSDASAFNVLSGGTLTLNNDADGVAQGTFVVTGNYAKVSGGAVNLSGGSLVANAVQFTDNRSINTLESYGGAIYASGGSNVTLNNCSFENNTARSSTKVNVQGTIYQKGEHPAYGGAVYSSSSTVNMSGCTFTANAADVEGDNGVLASGGAVYIGNQSSGSMKDCTVTSNQTSYNGRTGAGVCVAVGENNFAFSGKTIIKDNHCYFLREDIDNGLNENDNLHLEGGASNISVDTSKLSAGSEIYLTASPNPSENSDFRSLISDKSHKASSTDYFVSDVGGYVVQSNTDSDDGGLYLVAGSSYADLWYGCKIISRFDQYGEVDGNYFYYGFFGDEALTQDTGFTRLTDAVAALQTGGKIHMLESYEVSVSETVNMPKNKIVNVVRESSLGSNPMFKLQEGTFIINSSEDSSTIIFDGQNCAASTDGGAFYAMRKSNFELNGVQKPDGTKSIIIQNNKITGSYNYGAGLYIWNDKSKISNCEIKNNSTEGLGGGIYFSNSTGSYVLENCNITGNTASQNGGGVYMDEGTYAMFGTMNITGNTVNSAANNLYVVNEVGLASGSSSLSTGSQIGLTTSSTPAEGSPVKFASSATEAMKGYFTPDVSDYVVRFVSDENALYLAVPIYSNLWYKADDSGTKRFFEGESKDALTATDITEFKKAVECMAANGTIHMLTQYASSSNEVTAVPAGKNITVVRDESFTDASMFKITDGKFEINATDATSSLTFDGNNVSATAKFNGGAFYVSSSGSIKLSGAEKTVENEKVKTIVIKDNIVSSSGTSSVYTYGGGVYITGSGTNTLENCSITGNTVSSAASSSAYARGGGVYITGSGTNTLENCSITGNTASSSFSSASASADGGGVYITGSGTNTLENCSITGNTVSSSSSADGGGVYIWSGTNTLTNCSITGNTISASSASSASAYGGGVCIWDGTNTLENCSITGNTVSSSSSSAYAYASAYGGGVYIWSGTNTLTNCSITGNTISASSASSASAYGGGVYFGGGTNTLLGTTNITGNTAKKESDSSDSNLYLYTGYTVALSDSSGGALSADSHIGVTTKDLPTEGTDVKFATNATEDEMVYCFTSDEGYMIYKQGTDLYLALAPSDLYQSGNKFYLDAEKTKLTNIKTMAEAVKIAKNIHMLSSYKVTSSETLDIPSGKDVKVVRESSFNNNAMILAITGSFTVNATDTTSSITFDGNNVTTTISSGNSSAPWTYGSIFHVLGNPGITLTLNGAEKSDKSKTINVVNSNVSGGDTASGSAIRNNGTSVLTHCNVSNNKIASGAGSAAAGISNFGTLTMENCIVSNNENTASISGGIYTGSSAKSATFRGCTISGNISGKYGGGMYLNSGGTTSNTELKNIVENCTVINNKAGSSSVNGYGGGIYVCSGTSGTTTITGTTISGNDAIGGGGLYIIGGTNTITSCTITKNQKSSWGGGVRIDGGTNKFEGCSVTDNEASSRGGGFYFTTGGATTLTRCTISGNIAPDQGGAGICFTKSAKNDDGTGGTAGTLALSGAMSITGNKSKDSTDENNLWIGDGLTIDVSGLATEGSTVGILTENDPTSGNDLQFATNATEEMKACFTHDPGTSEVVYKDGGLYLAAPTYGELWYKADGNDADTKKFFEGSDVNNLTATDITKFSEAVQCLSASGKIHMLTSYESSSDETIDVPAGKNITVVRESSFTNESMINISGLFEVNCPHTNSTIIFDGKNVSTKDTGAGILWLWRTGSVRIIGASPSCKNIKFVNNVITTGGGAAIRLGGGDNVIKNCIIEGNKKNSTVSEGSGAVLLLEDGGHANSTSMENCDLINNTSTGNAGALYVASGTHSFTNCNITNNQGFGGGSYINGGTNSFTGCKISNNTAVKVGSIEPYGGGLYINNGTNYFLNCEINGNKAHNGGGLISKSASNTFEKCTVSGNVIDDYGNGLCFDGSSNTIIDCTITDNKGASHGAGIWIGGGTVNIYGNTVVKNNVLNDGTTENNLEVGSGKKVSLNDSAGKVLGTSSNIGITTANTPTSSAPVQFAEKGDETMEQCFTSDNSSYIVLRKGTDFYLSPPFSDLYYKDGKFYSDSGCTTDTGITKMSEAVASMTSSGNIHMLSQYASSVDETVTVPAGKNVTVLRESSFTNASMFSITGGTFEIDATDASSSVTFDGKSLSPTANLNGGVFYVGGDSTNLKISGAEDMQNIILQNNYVNHGVVWSPLTNHGGAIYFESGGSLTCNNCIMKNNAASMRGGAVCVVAGTNSFKNCTMDGNSKVMYGGGFASMGTAVNTFENCSFTNNSSSDYGGNLLLDDGTSTFTNCTISGGSTGQNGGGAYCTSATVTFKKCSVTGNKSSIRGGGIYFLRCTNSDVTVLDTEVTGNTASSKGGGIHVALHENQTEGKLKLSGATKITDNKVSSSANNVYCDNDQLIDVTGLATQQGAIGVTTAATPTASSPVKFAEKGDETMEQCFTSDNSSYIVMKKGTDFYLSPPFSDLYYKDGKFYSDSGCTTDTSMTKLSETMAPLVSSGTIHMLSQYASSSDETIDVPAGKNIAVVRDESFTNASMFKITGGNFTVNAPNADSSITFDGKNVSATTSFLGGAFCVFGNSMKFTLNGAEKTDGGKTIVIQNNKLSSGGGIYIGDGTNTLTNCSITGNTASSSGGGVRIYSGTSTLTSCSITGNTASDGGGVEASFGTNTLENCSITGNTASSSGGGVEASFGTTTLTNCSITGNTASDNGGGVYIHSGTNTLTNCSITGNTANKGGGVYTYGGTNTMLGTMNITGNTNESGTDSNLYVANGYTVALSDDSGGKLDPSSHIGVTTSKTPTEGTDVQFATNATEEMKACFTHDPGTSEVVYKDGGLYLKVAYSNLYYKNNNFYSDSACSSTTGITKFSDAVSRMTSTGTIHMLSQYASSSDETIDVPAGKNIAVVRESSFTNASMFKITGGTFTVNAPNANSSITFDGQKIETIVGEGGAFYVSGSSTKFTLNGADKSSVGKTITIENNIIFSSSAYAYANGGGICIRDGTNTLTNCSITGNTASYSSSYSCFASGGGVYINNGTNTLTNCSITGNTASSSSSVFCSAGGGGVSIVSSGTNTLTNCSITGNTVSSSSASSASSADGGGVSIGAGTNTLLGTTNITGNTAKAGSTSSDNNLYLSSDETVALSDSNGNKLSTSSKIGVTTTYTPTASTPIQFATNATEEMKACFTSDDGNYVVKYEDGSLYLKVAYSNLYYKNNNFYSDSACSSTTGITKFSDAVSRMTSTGTIHMLSRYESSSDETIDVPAGKNIAVVRESSFTNNSMFDITGGSFTVNAPNADSSITFDGKNVSLSATETFSGGAFNVSGSSTKFTLNGAEKTNGGKTIVIQNNTASSSGGGVYIYNGTNTLTNCSITGNTASSSGGGVYIYSGTNTLTNCSITGNTVSSSEVYAYGGGVRIVGGTNTLDSCSITGNTAKYGGGICVNYGLTMLGTMNITGNMDKSGAKNNLYVANGNTVALTSGSSKLDTSSQIGVKTSITPTADKPVQFATGATSAMASCFTSDNSSYKVTYSSSALSLATS